MALLSRINAVCNLCKISGTFSTLCANSYYLVKPLNSQILKIPVQTSSGKRYTSIFSIFRRPSVKKLKEWDNIPDEHQLVYRNAMDRYILASQILNAVSACIVGLIVITKDWRSTETNLTWGSGAGSVDNEMIFFITAFIGFCCVTQLYIARLPIRIYYLPQQKKYIMILYRSIPFMTRRITYTVNQVTKLPPRGILPWNDCNYEITNQQRVILIDIYFRKPSDFNTMLGYQKSSDDDDE